MNKTPTYELNKPGYDDTVDIEHINQNMDTLDKELKNVETAVNDRIEEHDKNTAKHISGDERTKLAKIETNATKNDTDENLKNRANHTGTQPASTISNFASAVRSTVLSGLSTLTGTAISATDTILTALGKLQKQINDSLAVLTAHTGDSTRHITAAERTTWNGKQDALSGNVTGHYHDADREWANITGKPVAYPPSTHGHTKSEITDMPTKLSQLQNDAQFVTQTELGQAGYGDMMASTYDSNSDGKVDAAENADKLGGQTPSHYAKQSDLSAHDDNSTRHITAAERTAWNGKQNALGFMPENVSKKGQANGYAALDASKKVPVSQLPALGVSQVDFDTHVDGLIPHGAVGFDTSYTYDASGNLTRIDVKQAGVLRARTTLAYTADKLTSSTVRQYASDGSTVTLEYTTTIQYDGEEIAGVKRVVA